VLELAATQGFDQLPIEEQTFAATVIVPAAFDRLAQLMSEDSSGEDWHDWERYAAQMAFMLRELFPQDFQMLTRIWKHPYWTGHLYDQVIRYAAQLAA
jgi:hypothetical protein